jgi:hypothetical protein
MTTFNALPSGVDGDTAELIVSMPLTSDDEVTYWFGLVQEAYDAGPDDPDTERFVQQLRETGGSLDSSGLEQFVQILQYGGDGLRPVARMLELSPLLPGVYWELYWQKYPADSEEAAEAPAEDGDRFGWVTQPHQERLAAAWGPEWATYLGEQLDYRWGAGWEANPADHKQHWMEDLINELLAQPADTATEDAAAGEAAAEGYEEVDADQLVEMLVADAMAQIDGADQLTAEDLEEVRTAVRNNVMEEIAR